MKLMRVILLLESVLSLISVADTTTLVRLHHYYSGRVEVSLDNGSSWEYLCVENVSAATVACRQLSCAQQEGSTVNDSHHVHHQFSCDGSEELLDNCSLMVPYFHYYYQNCHLFAECTPDTAQPEVSIDATRNSLWLSWSVPMHTCRQFIRNYVVWCYHYFYSINVTNVIKQESETSHTVYGLSPYTNYYCCVAVNYSHNVQRRRCIFGIRTLEDFPSRPRNFIISTLHSRMITASWSAPSPPNGLISQYRIECTVMESTPANCGQTRSTRSQRTVTVITGLCPHKNYRCCISAVNSRGEGQNSCRDFQTLEDVPSEAPIMIRATPSSTTLHLEWNPPSTEHRNGIITAYTLEIQLITPPPGSEHRTQVARDTSMQVENLRPYSRYLYRLSASTSAGVGVYSAYEFAQTLEDVPFEPPIISHVRPTSTTLYLEWNLPCTEYRNGIITAYTLEIQLITPPGSEHRTQVASNTSMLVENLRPYSRYQYRLSASTSAGVGNYSAYMLTQTLEDVPSGAPQDITAVVSSSTSFLLKWSPPLEEHQNGVIIGYRIIVEWDMREVYDEVNTSDTTHTLTALQEDTTYYYSLAAYTVMGVGPYSNRTPVTTLKDPVNFVLISSAGGTMVVLILLLIIVFAAIMICKSRKRRLQTYHVTISNQAVNKIKQKLSSKKKNSRNTYELSKQYASKESGGDSSPSDSKEDLTTIPELPARVYLDDTDFVHDLETELFPEKAEKGALAILATPDLPERHYSAEDLEDIEDTDPSTIPELPKRLYLDEKGFVHELETDILPEKMATTEDGDAIMDPFLTPKLPERRYIEDEDENSEEHDDDQEKEAPPKDNVTGQPFTSTNLSDSEPLRLPHSGEVESGADHCESDMSLIKATRREWECPSTSEEGKVYMSLREVREKTEYMSLSEMTRERKVPPISEKNKSGGEAEELSETNKDYMSLSEVTRGKQLEDQYMSLSDMTRRK